MLCLLNYVGNQVFKKLVFNPEPHRSTTGIKFPTEITKPVIAAF